LLGVLGAQGNLGEFDAVEPNQPGPGPDPEIAIAGLHQGRHRIIRQTISPIPGADNEIPQHPAEFAGSAPGG
jgi:hypothetical protein